MNNMTREAIIEAGAKALNAMIEAERLPSRKNLLAVKDADHEYILALEEALAFDPYIEEEEDVITINRAEYDELIAVRTKFEMAKAHVAESGYRDAVDRAVDPETGEIIDSEAMEGLEAIQMDRAEKIENCIAFIKDAKARAEAIKAEAKALTARVKYWENKAASTASYLQAALDGEKFESARGKISYRKSEVVVIADGSNIPDEYLRFSEPQPDKTAIKKAMKDGIEIPGVSLEEKQNIIIK